MQRRAAVVVGVLGVGAGADQAFELVQVAVEGGAVDPQDELRLLLPDVEGDIRFQLLDPPAVLVVLGEVAQDPPPVDEVDLQDVGKGLLVEPEEAAELADADRVGLRDVAEDRDLAEGALWLQHQESLLLAVFTNANTFQCTVANKV
uniref:GSVIVT00032933001, SOR n=1 Tax=Arundo donax TaxID=35708 RepID=A0A0A9CQY3_ARUDO